MNRNTFISHHPFCAPSHIVGRTLLIFWASSLIRSCSSAAGFELTPSFTRSLSLTIRDNMKTQQPCGKTAYLKVSWTNSNWFLRWFDVVTRWFVYGCTDKIGSFIGLYMYNDPPDVTSESSLLESLLSAELPVDQWRHVQCRLPSGSLSGQQALRWPPSPLWLPLPFWIL